MPSENGRLPDSRKMITGKDLIRFATIERGPFSISELDSNGNGVCLPIGGQYDSITWPDLYVCSSTIAELRDRIAVDGFFDLPEHREVFSSPFFEDPVEVTHIVHPRALRVETAEGSMDPERFGISLTIYIPCQSAGCDSLIAELQFDGD
jgi:hypothetical protein